MPAAGGGFEQAYNAQAVVAAGSLLVVAADVVQAPNDKQQLEPMLGKIEALPERWGAAETLLADAGYFSAANVEACRQAEVEPLIAMGRQPHHPPLGERFGQAGARAGKSHAGRSHGPSAEDARRPRALCFAQADAGAGVRRHQIGARISSVSTERGLDKVRGEWSIATMAWNLKRMFVLAPA